MADHALRRPPTIHAGGPLCLDGCDIDVASGDIFPTNIPLYIYVFYIYVIILIWITDRLLKHHIIPLYAAGFIKLNGRFEYNGAFVRR